MSSLLPHPPPEHSRNGTQHASLPIPALHAQLPLLTFPARTSPRPAASAKACFGHTEGTAGIHGALVAVLAAQLHSAPPIMHNRSLNPYVASAFDEWRSGRQSALPLVARQAAAWPAAPAALTGCSSFGMSGVNAHALFSAPHTRQRPQDGGEGDDVAAVVLAWQRQRHWPIPVYHRMLVSSLWDRASATSRSGSVSVLRVLYRCSWSLPTTFNRLPVDTLLIEPQRLLTPCTPAAPPPSLPVASTPCRFQCSLAASDLAYLFDHVVQGTSILPGAGMLEISTARWVDGWAGGLDGGVGCWHPMHSTLQT